MEFTATPELKEYLVLKNKKYIVVEVVSSDHSDIEITELYAHVVPDRKAEEFFKKRYVAKEADFATILLPPYRLHYAPIVSFTLHSFLGIKSIRQEGIAL